MKVTQKIDIALRVLSANLFKKRFPLSVYMHITDRCQSQCIYCEIPKFQRDELSTNQIFSLLEQIRKAGARRFHINGGEPLMREDIGEIVDYAKKMGLYVSLSSNGYLLPKRINQLKNLDIIFLSFNGPKEVHDRQRGEGSYDKVIEAFRLCQASGMRFWTTTVLTKINLNSIGFILEKAKEYSFAANFQVLYYPAGRHFKAPISSHPLGSFLLTKEEYQGIFRTLIQEKKHKRIVNSRAFFRYLLGWENYKEPYSREAQRGITCWAGKLYCWVDIDGSVYPCFDCIGRMDALNFLDVGFQNAFYNLKEGWCRSCILSCYAEMNLMFSFNPDAIYNYLRLI